VAYSLLDNIQVAEQAGAVVGDLYTTGGAAKSHVWTQIKADVTGHTVHVPQASEASSLGAALLAGVGVGAYTSFDDAMSNVGSIQRTHTPGDDQPIYADGFSVYRELYASLKELMAETSRSGLKAHQSKQCAPTKEETQC
jgi:xylulokinase